MATATTCGHQFTPTENTPGYGLDANGVKYCYACCAERDIADMRNTGRATLYLTNAGISNWPGSLKIKVGYRKSGRHNFAGTRTDVWFTGPDKANWHGVQYGENTEIVHCRRVKS